MQLSTSVVALDRRDARHTETRLEADGVAAPWFGQVGLSFKDCGTDVVAFVRASELRCDKGRGMLWNISNAKALGLSSLSREMPG